MNTNQLLEMAKQSIEAAEAEMDNFKHSPIAVIGYDCRFPGKANSPREFWHLLENGEDAISEIPKERWDIEELYHEDHKEIGKMSTRYGSFIDNYDKFDPAFFDISPREAMYMDPQQRILLETTWGALQAANVNISKINNKKIGVYVGIFNGDYDGLILKKGISAINAYYGTGNSVSIASGRLAFFLGTIGPCLTIDTACSSSLVALVQACNDIRAKRCEMAIVAGVNLILSPELSVNFSKANMLAPDGRCKTFDESANGYVRGEGCGVVILKGLNDAIDNKDNVYGVIKGVAVNHDGHSSGLTVPSEHAQEELILTALDNAKINPSDVTYLEAHGTGTSLGDPIEFEALSRVYKQGREPSNPLIIGSVKTNIGHLEPAAGIAGLIKIILCLKNKKITKNLHFKKINKEIDLSIVPAVVPTELMDWNIPKDKKRIAAISSFGFSGTNAHVIIEEFLPQKAEKKKNYEREWHLINISAMNETSLKNNAKNLINYIETHNPEICDLAYSSACSHMRRFHYRVALVGNTQAAITTQISNFINGTKSEHVFYGDKVRENIVAFLFTGQGAQYHGMCKELYHSFPVFKAHFDLCNQHLEPLLKMTLLDLINADDNLLSQTLYTQTATFAIEYSLAKLWQSWGITPDYVLGHSIGEIAAACICGYFSLEDAIKLVFNRGRLMQSLPSGGGMLAVIADLESVEKFLIPYENSIDIAAINGKTQIVLSGKLEYLKKIMKDFEKEKIKIYQLPVSHAFHSKEMEPILQDFQDAISTVQFKKPTIPFVSTLTGKKESADHGLDADYWTKHIISTVDFKAGLEVLVDLGITHAIEIGPKQVLTNLAKNICKDSNIVFMSSLMDHEKNSKSLMQCVACLYVDGIDIDFEALNAAYVKHKLPLPRYAFLEKRYWFDMDENIKVNAENSAQTIETNLSIAYADINLYDKNGNCLLQVKNYETRPVDAKNFSELLTQFAPHQDWFYQLSWIKQGGEIQTKQDYPSTHNIVLFVNNPKTLFVQACQSYFKQRLILVVQDDAYLRISSHEFHLSLLDKNHIEKFNSELPEKEAISFIYGMPFDKSDVGKLSSEQIYSFLQMSCEGLLNLIKFIANQSRNIYFHFLTKNAHSMNNVVIPEERIFYSLARTFQNEFPEFGVFYHDMDDNNLNYNNFLKAVEKPSNEKNISYRDGEMFYARFSRLHKKVYAVESKTDLFHEEYSYLITGGTGDLAEYLARWMIERGARHLILLGRSALNDKTRQKIANLERVKENVNVKFYQVDVSVEEDLAYVFRKINSEEKPLRGIFHCAGVLDNAILINQTWEKFSNALKPKAFGVRNLHNLSKSYNLDYFVMFSSIVADACYAGQGNYSAANSYLNAFAEYRRSMNLPALCVCWGPWAEVGMMQRVKRNNPGLFDIPLEKGFLILESLLRSDVSYAVVADIDWQEYFLKYGGNTTFYNFFGKVNEKENVYFQKSENFPTPVKISEAKQASFTKDEIKEKLESIVKKILLFDEEEEISDTLGFTNMGMDSLMLMELKEKVEIVFKKNLFVSTASIFSYPNIKEMSEYIFSQYPIETNTDADVKSSSAQTGSLADTDESVLKNNADVSSMTLNDIDNYLNEILKDEDSQNDNLKQDSMSNEATNLVENKKFEEIASDQKNEKSPILKIDNDQQDDFSYEVSLMSEKDIDSYISKILEDKNLE